MERINRMQVHWKDFNMSKDYVATNSPLCLLLLKGLWQHGEKGSVLLDRMIATYRAGPASHPSSQF